MKKEQAAAVLGGRYGDYLAPAKKPGQFICPLCGHGKNGDGLEVVPKSKGGDGKRLHCFGCGFHGDLIDLFGAEHGYTAAKAFGELCRLYGLRVDEDVRPPRTNPPAPGNPPADYTDYYARAQARLSDPAAAAYLEQRGIGAETAYRFGLGYDPAWKSPTALQKGKNPPESPRIILPTGPSSYVARDIRPHVKEYGKMKEGAAGLFNREALYNREERPVFLVEGEFDALSLAELGAEAVALGSTANKGKLLEAVKEKKPSGPLILSLDQDEAGKRAQAGLTDDLRTLGIPWVAADISGGCKDPNERLQADREGVRAALEAAEQSASRQPDGVGYYLSRLMAGEIQRFQEGAHRRTGFENLDQEAGGIYPGLYVLGAISSLGKTTFLHQMGDQLAAAGEHVLYFSLEQSRLELVSKSLSRLTAQRDIHTAQTSLSIRRGRLTPAVLEAADVYADRVGDRLSVIEGNFRCTVAAIDEYAARYQERNRVKPVVMVDYLQILQAGGPQRHSVKELIDSNVTELKRLSRGRDIPVFVVSSVNRSNYLTPIDFESFKESGGIEYTADVVWGLQLEVLNEELFSKESRLKEKREKVRSAKAENPRKVELVCLKNRYGVSSYKASFDYYPQYDLFRPAQPQKAEPPRVL